MVLLNDDLLQVQVIVVSGESVADPAGVQGLEPLAGPGPKRADKLHKIRRTWPGSHAGSIVLRNFRCSKYISLVKLKK